MCSSCFCKDLKLNYVTLTLTVTVTEFQLEACHAVPNFVCLFVDCFCKIKVYFPEPQHVSQLGANAHIWSHTLWAFCRQTGMYHVAYESLSCTGTHKGFASDRRWKYDRGNVSFPTVESDDRPWRQWLQWLVFKLNFQCLCAAIQSSARASPRRASVVDR